MLNTWKASFNLLLKKLAANPAKLPRIAIIGIGNLFRSDDAAGILVARALAQRKCAADTNHVLIIEAGSAPENRTGELRRFDPDLVLIIDAAEMGETPGAIRWISEEEIDGMSASTHSLPLSMLIHYLKLELNCDVRLLGIQAVSNEVGEEVNTEVLRAIDEATDGLNKLIYGHLSKASL